MGITHSDLDPYTPDAKYVECLHCGMRETGSTRLSECSVCGGPVHNIAVARE